MRHELNGQLYSGLLVLSVAFGCAREVRKPTAETIGLQQDMRDLVSVQKSLTTRVEMLAERVSLMEDRISVQEARNPVNLPKLPIVKLMPEESTSRPPTAETGPVPRIEQRDVEPQFTKIPKLVAPKVAKQVRSQPRRVQDVSLKQTQSRMQRSADLNDPSSVISRGTAHVNRGDFADTLVLMRNFHAQYPRSDLREYALLLEGRAYFGQGETEKAIQIFEALIKHFPNGATVPDTLYMIGLSQERLGHTRRAVETLARLKTIYPATEAGKRAAAALSGRQKSL